MIFLSSAMLLSILSEYGVILRYITGIQSSFFKIFSKKHDRLAPCSSIPLRFISLTGCASSPSGLRHAARFRFASSRSRVALPVHPACAMQLDFASLHLAHGLRFRSIRLAPCSSISLRFISLTGCALCKKKRGGPHSCEHDEIPLFSSCAWLKPSLQICSNSLG